MLNEVYCCHCIQPGSLAAKAKHVRLLTTKWLHLTSKAERTVLVFSWSLCGNNEFSVGTAMIQPWTTQLSASILTSSTSDPHLHLAWK